MNLQRGHRHILLDLFWFKQKTEKGKFTMDLDWGRFDVRSFQELKEAGLVHHVNDGHGFYWTPSPAGIEALDDHGEYLMTREPRGSRGS